MEKLICLHLDFDCSMDYYLDWLKYLLKDFGYLRAKRREKLMATRLEKPKSKQMVTHLSSLKEKLRVMPMGLLKLNGLNFQKHLDYCSDFDLNLEKLKVKPIN